MFTYLCSSKLNCIALSFATFASLASYFFIRLETVYVDCLTNCCCGAGSGTMDSSASAQPIASKGYGVV